MGDFCVFCGMVNGEVETDKVLESEHFFVILDKNPKTEMHSLVIPKDHYVTFLDIPSRLFKEYLETVAKTITLVCEKAGTKDYNLLSNNGTVAGQVVCHSHLHVIPRKEGDDFKLYC